MSVQTIKGAPLAPLKIQRQISLPFSKAWEISLKSIKIRLARSIITASGIFLGIAFYSAVKAAGLVDTLSGPGPFTVFAPTDDAFAKLPAGTVDTLVKPESKKTLTKILTYHVVAGDVSSTELVKMIKAGNGKASLKTVEGEALS